MEDNYYKVLGTFFLNYKDYRTIRHLNKLHVV